MEALLLTSHCRLVHSGENLIHSGVKLIHVGENLIHGGENLIHSGVKSIHSGEKANSAECALQRNCSGLQCALCSVLFALCTLHCAVRDGCTLECVLCSVQ